VTGIELIDAGAGDDVVTASAAADVLKGGLGNDTLIFAAGFGNDTISDFQVGSASQPLADVIDLSAFHYTSFAELQTRMTQMGADTVIDIDPATSLRLVGITVSQLQGNDFVL
jgi:Ca2+-binding RTX toxin-like protein